MGTLKVTFLIYVSFLTIYFVILLQSFCVEKEILVPFCISDTSVPFSFVSGFGGSLNQFKYNMLHNFIAMFMQGELKVYRRLRLGIETKNLRFVAKFNMLCLTRRLLKANRSSKYSLQGIEQHLSEQL